MVDNGPNGLISTSLSAPFGFDQKSGEHCPHIHEEENEKQQDNDSTDQEAQEEVARAMWDLGKEIGLYASNDDEIIKALKKTKKDRDIKDVLKKRGRG